MFDLGFEEIDITAEQDIEAAGEEQLAELSGIADNITAAAGVCASDAASLESLVEGFLSDRFPIESFTRVPSPTNMKVSLEFIDTNNKLIMGGIIAAGIAIIGKILHWLYKFFSGDDSVGGGGGGGASGKAAATLDSTDKTAKDNQDKAKDLNPSDVAKAEQEAIDETLKEHHVSKLMNKIYSAGGSHSPLYEEIISFGSSFKEIIDFIRTKIKTLMHGEFFNFYAPVGQTMQATLENKARVKEIAAMCIEEERVAKIIRHYSDGAYDVMAEGNNLNEGGRKLVEALSKMASEKGTNIRVDNIYNDYKSFDVKHLDMSKQGNIGSSIEDVTKEINAFEKYINQSVEKAPEASKETAVNLARETINILRNHLGLIVQMARAMVIVLNELNKLLKLSESFQKKFSTKLNTINNAKDHFNTVGHMGA